MLPVACRMPLEEGVDGADAAAAAEPRRDGIEGAVLLRLHWGGGRGNAQGICVAAGVFKDKDAAVAVLLSNTMCFLTQVTACRVAIRSEKDLCRRLLYPAAPPVLRTRRPSTRDVERGEEAAAAAG